MNASLKALYDRFIAMGFIPDADNERSLSHPNYEPMEGYKTHIIFHDDYYDYNYSGDALEEFIINAFKSEIMEYLTNGPFKGYERYRMQFIGWHIVDEFIGASIRCPLLNIDSDQYGIFYDITSGSHNCQPAGVDSLRDMIENYESNIGDINSTQRDNVVTKLKTIGFEQITKIGFTNSRYPMTDTHDNLLFLDKKRLGIHSCCKEIESEIINLFAESAADITKCCLLQPEKYEISISEWKLLRGGLFAKIACDGLQLFRWGEVIYNVITNKVDLTINGPRYNDMWEYLCDSRNTSEIMHMITTQYRQLVNENRELSTKLSEKYPPGQNPK